MAETIGARERGRITPDEGAVLAAETARNADFGKPVLIYPNLYLVRVPLPHNPLRALNSYFILDDDGTTTIVDFACPNKGESLRYGLDLTASRRSTTPWPPSAALGTRCRWCSPIRTPITRATSTAFGARACRCSRTFTRSRR